MNDPVRTVTERPCGLVPKAKDDAREVRKVLIAAPVGTTLEWFDFGLYGALSAVVFPRLFFPDLDPTAGVLASLASFGVGMAMRPLGAAIFSNVGDRAGRKKAIVVSIYMMGSASLGIALLPGYGTLGIWAPTLLVVFRCLQGLSLGGESTAAQLMAMEHAPARRRAFYGSVVNLGAPAGLALVTLALVGVRGVAGEQGFLEWAWRIPFVIGFVMAVLGFVIRRHIDETPVFVEASKRYQASGRPLLTTFRRYPARVARLTFLWAPNVAVAYIVNTYSVHYVTHDLGMSTQLSFTLVLWSTILGVVAIPLGGLCADKYGRKPVLFIGTSISLVGLIAYFPLLNTQVYPQMLLAMVLTMNGQGFAFGALGAVLAEHFPTSVRYSGHAATYTLTNLVGGAGTPLIATFLVQTTGTTWSITAIIVASYCLSLYVIYRTPETRHIGLHNPDEPLGQILGCEALPRSPTRSKGAGVEQ